MRILDLFCGGGGAGMGYASAGHIVVGVDNKQRKCGYPAGDLIIADALEVMDDTRFLRSFDLISASPPCQTHTRAKHLRDAQKNSTKKVDLISQTRDALAHAGVPFIIENVPGAPLRQDLLLCGSMFNLHIFDSTGKRWLKRHRIFEMSGIHIPQPSCNHKEAGIRPLGVYGSKNDRIPGGGQTVASLDDASILMGIDWMSWTAIVEAIPPAYTNYIAKFL